MSEVMKLSTELDDLAQQPVEVVAAEQRWLADRKRALAAQLRIERDKEARFRAATKTMQWISELGSEIAKVLPKVDALLSQLK